MGLLSSRKKKQAADVPGIKALLFDVFGTTVDWSGSMTAHAQRLGADRGIEADWAGLVQEWRARYKPAIKPVREGKRKWTGFDTLQREQLDKILVKYGAKKLSKPDRDLLTQGWHYLAAWPDVVPGLTQLKQKFVIAPLSNGTTKQMVDLAKWSGLPWDAIFGADLFRTYKPDKKLYLGAAALLELKPGEILMVAAHNEDLAAARKLGLKTCFIRRETEDGTATAIYDYTVGDFVQLARVLTAN